MVGVSLRAPSLIEFLGGFFFSKSVLSNCGPFLGQMFCYISTVRPRSNPHSFTQISTVIPSKPSRYLETLTSNMTTSRFLALGLLVLAAMTTLMVSALPHEGTSKHPAQRLQGRREDTPAIPRRPKAVGLDAFHGSQFQFFDEHGFVAGSPGVEAAPVFLYSRTQSIYVCIASPIVMNSGAVTLNIAGTGSVLSGECNRPGFEPSQTKPRIAEKARDGERQPGGGLHKSRPI